jgi:hypothetical protein
MLWPSVSKQNLSKYQITKKSTHIQAPHAQHPSGAFVIKRALYGINFSSSISKHNTG